MEDFRVTDYVEVFRVGKKVARVNQELDTFSKIRLQAKKFHCTVWQSNFSKLSFVARKFWNRKLDESIGIYRRIGN